MSILAVPNIHQIRAAMFRALSAADGSITETEYEAIEDIDKFLADVIENPCSCPLGAACHYLGEPPGEADTGHCQQCGVFRPTEAVCSNCGTDYIFDEGFVLDNQP